MTATTIGTVQEVAETLGAMNAMGEALGLSPCEALGAFFPAIVGDDDVMEALATLLTPALEEVSAVVAAGVIPADEGERFVHNVYHLLQISAALGHALGVAEAIGGMDDDIPADLSAVDWADLPDTFGEDDGPEAG